VALNFESRVLRPRHVRDLARQRRRVGVYGDRCPYPVATSFAVEVYRILPNDTTSRRSASGRFTG
jgi:hypothetical protein